MYTTSLRNFYQIFHKIQGNNHGYGSMTGITSGPESREGVDGTPDDTTGVTSTALLDTGTRGDGL